MSAISDGPKAFSGSTSLRWHTISRPLAEMAVTSIGKPHPLQRSIARLQQRAEDRAGGRFGFTSKLNTHLSQSIDGLTQNILTRFPADRIMGKYQRSQESPTHSTPETLSLPLAFERGNPIVENPVQEERLPEADAMPRVNRTYPNFTNTSPSPTMQRDPSEESSMGISPAELPAVDGTKKAGIKGIAGLIADSPRPSPQRTTARRMVRLEDVRNNLQRHSADHKPTTPSSLSVSPLATEPLSDPPPVSLANSPTVQRELSLVPPRRIEASEAIRNSEAVPPRSTLTTSKISPAGTRPTAEQAIQRTPIEPPLSNPRHSMPESHAMPLTRPGPDPIVSPDTIVPDISTERQKFAATDSGQVLANSLGAQVGLDSSPHMPEPLSEDLSRTAGQLTELPLVLKTNPTVLKDEPVLSVTDTNTNLAPPTTETAQRTSSATPTPDRSEVAPIVRRHSTSTSVSQLLPEHPSQPAQDDPTTMLSSIRLPLTIIESHNPSQVIQTPSSPLSGFASKAWRQPALASEGDGLNNVDQNDSSPQENTTPKAGSATQFSNLEELSLEAAAVQMAAHVLPRGEHLDESDTSKPMPLSAVTLPPINSSATTVVRHAAPPSEGKGEPQISHIAGRVRTLRMSDLLPVVRRAPSNPNYISRKDTLPEITKNAARSPISSRSTLQLPAVLPSTVMRAPATAMREVQPESNSGSSASATTAPQTSEGSAPPSQNIDVHTLATQVYPLIKRLLSIERERLQGV